MNWRLIFDSQIRDNLLFLFLLPKPKQHSFNLALSPSEQKEAYSKLVHEAGKAGFQIGYWWADKENGSKVDEAEVKCPMLVVGAEEDRITPASVVRKVAKKYGADYKEFTGHAHWVLGEPNWQEVADYVAEWLEEKG